MIGSGLIERRPERDREQIMAGLTCHAKKLGIYSVEDRENDLVNNTIIDKKQTQYIVLSLPQHQFITIIKPCMYTSLHLSGICADKNFFLVDIFL